MLRRPPQATKQLCHWPNDMIRSRNSSIGVVAPRRLSTQKYLFALVAAVVIPLLAFTAFLLFRYAATERARFEHDAVEIASQIALIIDGELQAMVALLRGLAASSALATDDLARFHAEATRLVEGQDQVIVLRDMGEGQLLNTQRPFGAALPPAVPIPEPDQVTFAAGRLIVSDVYLSPISGEPRIAVAVPIIRDGGVARILAITVPTARLHKALVPAVPAGWIIGVGDRKGIFVTRSTRHDEITGKPGVPEYLAQAIGKSGTFKSRNFEGTALLAGFYRSDFSGWLYAANIPQRVVEAPLWGSLTLLGGLGTGALALSAGLAYLFGRRFTAATSALVKRAEALGEGRNVPPINAHLAEFAMIDEALGTAASAVRERTRELQSVLSTVPAAVWFTYDPDGRHVVRNRFGAALLRVPDDEFGSLATPDGALAHVRLLKDGRPLQSQEMPLQRAMRNERVNDEEYTLAFADGTKRTLLTSATALRGEDGATIGAVSVSLDISERKRVEEQRELLINELNHRVKNMLATVQSLAHHTLRGATSQEDARAALTDRLMALARVHDVLTRESWERAELYEIVAGAIAPHQGHERFTVQGPTIFLSPALSLSLALAVHELATNAVKYGALATQCGTVAITWHVQDRLKEPWLTFKWAERGGRSVLPPTRRGFGTRLLERSISPEPGATARMDYAPDGLVWIMETPIRSPAVFSGVNS